MPYRLSLLKTYESITDFFSTCSFLFVFFRVVQLYFYTVLMTKDEYT